MAANTLSDSAPFTLPAPIADRLRAVIRRVRWIQLTRGLLATGAVGCFALLAVMAADAGVALSRPLRLTLSLLALLVTLLAAWRFLLRPLCRKISTAAVARWLEIQHPEMQERISTAVELAGRPDAGTSRVLLEEVVRDAVADAGRIRPEVELSGRRARGPAIALLSGLGILGVLFALWPAAVPRLVARALAPLAEIEDAWAGQIRLVTGSQTVALGEPLNLEAAVKGKPDRVAVRMTLPDGTTVEESLLADPAVKVGEGESGYALRIPAAERSFSGVIAMGRATSPPFTVTVLPRPSVESYTLTWKFPEYTGRKEEMKENAGPEIVAPAGTTVKVKARLSRPVQDAEALVDGKASGSVQLAEENGQTVATWETVLAPGTDTNWYFQFRDSHGIASLREDAPFRAEADRAPAVTIDSPLESEFELRPTEKLPLEYTVREDFGVQTVTLQLLPQGKPERKLPVNPLPARATDSTEWRGNALVDLAQLDLADVPELVVALIAADNLPADRKGPQTGRSRELKIRIRRDAKSLMEQTVAAQAEEIRKAIEDAKKELVEARQGIENKPDLLRAAPEIQPEALREIEETAGHSRKASEILGELAERMKDTAYARQSPDLARIAADLVDPATEKVSEIPLRDDRTQRADLAQQAKDNLQKAIEKLDEEHRQNADEQQQAQAIAQLQALAEEQARLAREAAQARDQEAQQAATEAREIAEMARELSARQEAIA
ncbi:MAG: hypothetical protein ACK5CW_01215, partial [Verrucomicrobiota bacterium]